MRVSSVTGVAPSALSIFVPVTVTVRLAPGAPEFGDRLEIVGTIGKLTVALAEVPRSEERRVGKEWRGGRTAPHSEEKRKKMLPSATAKLTDPLPGFKMAR